MKKILLLASVSAAVFFSACQTSQLATTSVDDVYSNPKEEKKAREAAAAAQAKADAEERQKQADAAAAQKAKDDANPYYKDPQYNSDDYYDYAYASRINRFQTPLYGASYYDPYYTNMYTYNQNPAMYGTSIYSTYNYYGMPSSQFNNYSMGISTGWGYGAYNNYGNYGYGFGLGYSNMGYGGYYNDPFYNSYYGYPYYGSMYSYYPYSYGYGGLGYYGGYGYPGYFGGYNLGFYNGFSAGQYYNSLDPNSAYGQVQYGPRTTSGGGNSGTRTEVGMPQQSSRSAYIQSIANEQNSAPRFTNYAASSSRNAGGNISNGSGYPDRMTNQQMGGGRSNSGYYQNNGSVNNPNTGRPQNDRMINNRENRSINENNNSGNRNSNFDWNNGNSGGGFRDNGFRNEGGGGRSSGGGGNSRPR